jgi:hypothetical protein
MDEKDLERKSEELLDLVVRSLPRIEPPPFFAARVASRALIEEPSLLYWLNGLGRRLTPLLFSAAIVLSAVSYQVATVGSSLVVESELLFEQESSPSTITIGTVLDSMDPAFEEEEILEYSR